MDVANQVTAWFAEKSGNVEMTGSVARKLAVTDAQRGPTEMVPDDSLKASVENATLPLRKCGFLPSHLSAVRKPLQLLCIFHFYQYFHRSALMESRNTSLFNESDFVVLQCIPHS